MIVYYISDMVIKEVDTFTKDDTEKSDVDTHNQSTQNPRTLHQLYQCTKTMGLYDYVMITKSLMQRRTQINTLYSIFKTLWKV